MSNATHPQDASAPDANASGWTARAPTALLVLANGDIFEGFGVGATGVAVGEVCFNTAMTGYEEILTDPSYAAQILTFTFPHIGVVGTNEEDIETVNLAASAGARGAIFRADITDSSNFRATRRLDDWLRARGIIGLTGVDTRALTAMIRRDGMPNAVIAHDPKGEFDREALPALLRVRERFVERALRQADTHGGDADASGDRRIDREIGQLHLEAVDGRFAASDRCAQRRRPCARGLEPLVGGVFALG